MSKGNNQKLKLLYLAKIMMEETDEEHGLSIADITSKHEEYGTTADRKTLYSDFEELRKFRIDIIGEQRQRGHRFSADRHPQHINSDAKISLSVSSDPPLRFRAVTLRESEL